MKTITALARSAGLSRSTLLYYDRIGLLVPSARSAAGYRLYAAADEARLEQIRSYRAAGLGLEQIADVLSAPEQGDPVESPSVRQLLIRRLDAIRDEIDGLRAQQQVICSLLDADLPEIDHRGMDKAQWVAIMRAAGFDASDMRSWHAEFERLAPDAHQDFLAALMISPEDILRIRTSSTSDHR